MEQTLLSDTWGLILVLETKDLMLCSLAVSVPLVGCCVLEEMDVETVSQAKNKWLICWNSLNNFAKGFASLVITTLSCKFSMVLSYCAKFTYSVPKSSRHFHPPISIVSIWFGFHTFWMCTVCDIQANGSNCGLCVCCMIVWLSVVAGWVAWLLVSCIFSWIFSVTKLSILVVTICKLLINKRTN
jgi:hypothetical protein